MFEKTVIAFKKVKAKFGRKFIIASSTLGLTLGALSAEVYAACSYTVTNEWSNGFNATVRVTNTTDVAINGWNIQWQYSGNNRANSAWSANLSGNNPYVATNLSWNGFIQPGQYVEFGVQGSKQSGTAEIPALSGAACGSENSAGRVYLQVDKADDHLFVYVDGVEKMRWSTPKSARSNDGAIPVRIGEKIDITELLAEGDNQIKVVAAADNWYSLSGGYDVRIWHGSNLIMDERQDYSFGNVHFSSILFNDTITVHLNDAEPRRTLTVNADGAETAIYLNNVFTGKYAPASFELAPGEYRVGLGESTSMADWSRNTAIFTGQFREQDIVIGDQHVTLNATEMPILDQPNEWKVAVVPYTEVHFGLTNAEANAGVSAAANNIGIMTNDDIAVAVEAVRATSDKWLLPLSYGLMKWDVTLLPTVTQKVYHTDSFLWNPAMINADLSSYDMVIHLIANRTLMVDSNGHRVHVANNINGSAGRPNAYMPQSWLNAEGNTLAERLQNVLPSTGMLHEALHTYDNYRLNDYNGVEQVHGADAHGYTTQDCGLPSEWLCWYRGYVRSQIGEDESVLSKVATSAKISGQDVVTYIGAFNMMRGGRSAKQLWSYSKPISEIRNAGTQSCLDVAGADASDGAEIVSWSCHGDVNQLWSFRHVQNGTYHLVSEHSQKCAEFGAGQMFQQTCSTSLAQRYLLDALPDGTFNVKTLSGQCMAFSTAGQFLLQPCDDNQMRQRWQFD